jgi:signal transduction histidine kinase
MGLDIARRLIEAHSGTIECRSELGKGTTFTIRLPLSPRPVSERPRRDNVDAEALTTV